MKQNKPPLINPTFVVGLFMLLVLYVSAATATFAFRHPWATQTEILLSFDKVLTFQKVNYKTIQRMYEETDK